MAALTVGISCFICTLCLLLQVFGTTQVPFKELPLLEVRLPDAVPEAFDMVLNYIYTDRIDPTKKSKCIWFAIQNIYSFFCK